MGNGCGGEVVRIAAGSRDHINAKERSIIDRCVGEVYEEYQHGGAVPTLRVLREKFLEQEEPEAQDLALVSELFTNGSLNAFAHESNVDVNNRIMVYDILDLGKQLKTMGLLVITDAMLNRVTENWKQGKRTHIFLDEFHVVFENEYFGAFFNSAWRRFRKRNAFPTAITQNVEYLLDSVLASTMIHRFLGVMQQSVTHFWRTARIKHFHLINTFILQRDVWIYKCVQRDVQNLCQCS